MQVCLGQTLNELEAELKIAADKPSIHRLKSQIARAAMQELENGELTKSAREKRRAQIQAYCADVLLGSMDLWYAESVVTWSRLLVSEGDWKTARSDLLDQVEVLQNIEKNLRANRIPISSISPVSGCRYVLAETYRAELEEFQTLEPAIEALRHYYNVYIKYSDSPWGEKAQAKAEKIQTELEARGKKVRIELGAHKQTFAINQFRLGARLVSEDRFADAVEPIETAINVYPETENSVSALRNLALCKLETGSEEEGLAVLEYCCERFASSTNTPVAVLGLGRKAVDSDRTDFGVRALKLYLREFPEHEKRADVFSWFAWRAYKDEKWVTAIRYFESLEYELRKNGLVGEPLEKAIFIQATHPPSVKKLDAFMTEFPTSEWVAPALNKKAQAQLVADDYSGAFQTLEKLKSDYPESSSARTALSGLIVSAVDAGQFDVAEKVLHRMLENKVAYGDVVFLETGSGLLRAEKFSLAAMAFHAVYEEGKTESLDEAGFGLASSMIGRGEFEDSYEILKRVLEQIPNSGRFYEIRLMQARCLVQMGRTEEAVAAYTEAGNGDYAVTLEMAPILKRPEDRLAAYQRIALLADPDLAKNRPLIARSIVESLPLCMELGKYDLAVGSCEQFEKLFPEHDDLSIIDKFRREAERALVN